MKGNLNDIDAFLKGLSEYNETSLEEVFEKRLSELKMPRAQALKTMGIQLRSLNGILSGTQKQVDITILIRLSNFLQISREEVARLYMDVVEANYKIVGVTSDEVKFIKENFDLTILHKAGLIDNIRDFEHIKKRLTERLGLTSIFEYRKPSIDVAFSSGIIKQDNNLTRSFWINSALATLRELDNPNHYDREDLIKIFPKIRWYSTKLEEGLVEVSKLLFEIGITVVYQPTIRTLALRGATFSYNSKPCIVLTNYKNFYPTLWFALIHELYHVLFDWDDIKANRYHLTDDSITELSVREREKEADEFSREYLFSKEKSQYIKPYLNDDAYVSKYAYENSIHPSLIYVFYAYDNQASNRMAWAMAKKKSPSVEKCKKPFEIPWNEKGPIEKVINKTNKL